MADLDDLDDLLYSFSDDYSKMKDNQKYVNIMINGHFSIKTVENRFAVVTKSVNDMILKGETIIERFNTHKQSLTELIKKRFEELIKIAERRKQELLSQLEENTLSTTTSVQLDIEQCKNYLTTIQSQSDVMETAKSNDEYLHNILGVIDYNLSDIKLKILSLFQVNDIHVDLEYNLPDDLIKNHGKVLQPSSQHSKCSVAFIKDHFEIILTTKTADDKLYPYGGLSANAYIVDKDDPDDIDDKNDKDDKDVTDNKDGTYLIKLLLNQKRQKHKKPPIIIVKLNDQIVAKLTNLYALFDQYDIPDIILHDDIVIDAGDNLFIKSSHISSLRLVCITRESIDSSYSNFSYSDGKNNNYFDNISSSYFNDNHKTTISTFSLKENNYISLYKQNESLYDKFTAKSYSDIKDVSQAICVNTDFALIIVFVNNLPNCSNFKDDDCKIGILNCTEKKIRTRISSHEVGLIDIKIVLRDEYIYVIGRDKNDKVKKILKLFDMTGELLKTILFKHEIHSLYVYSDIVIIATDGFISLYDKDFITRKCQIPVNYKYDIIRCKINFDRASEVYAISNSNKVLSTWKFWCSNNS